MNKKGFTLIELLAVIVILAIIALIAVPQILGIVEKSRKSAAESSAYGYVDAIEKQIIINEIKNENIIDDGEYNLPMTTYGVKVKGDIPTSGTIVIEKKKVTTGEMCINNYSVKYENNKATIIKKCDEEKVEASEIEYKDGKTVSQVLDELREEM